MSFPLSPTLHDPPALWLMFGVFGLLAFASLVGYILARRQIRANGVASQTIINLDARLRAWWVIVSLCAAAILLGPLGTTLLFGVTSFLALREFFALTPTDSEDHQALFWVFFVITPLQYFLVIVQWHHLFTLLIPVYAFLFIPTRLAICGQCENFLERVARTQWGLMICVYCVSYVPALILLPLSDDRQGPRLLLFFLLVVQFSDVFQYLWGKGMGRRKIAPRVSPNKTWEGFLGGVATATALGSSLWWITPFRPWQAAILSLIIALLGFAGGLTMSAVKRGKGVKDYGALIKGHGGVLDRIDSICFAAPVFYYSACCYFT